MIPLCTLVLSSVPASHPVIYLLILDLIPLSSFPSHFLSSPYFVGLVCLFPCLMFKVCLKICRSATWGPDSMMEATLKSGYRLSNLVSPLVIKVI